MKKGILVVSFGTSYEETLKKNIERIENRIRDAFEPITVRRAFTSNMIIKKLRNNGVNILTTEEALAEMISEGFTDIIVQPLHVIPGFEYEKVQKAVAKARHNRTVIVKLGKPLLDGIETYRELIDAFSTEFEPEVFGKGYLLMGHGTDHFANAAYSLLQRLFNEKRNDVMIANVDGFPELGDVLEDLKERFTHLTLVPLMMVAGDHAINDMAGEEEDSFKSVLNAEGINVTCILKGMGENPEIGELFVKRIIENME